MIALVLMELVDILKAFAAALSIVLSARKLYRIVRRVFKHKKKPTE
ncbi:hypothetical protein [Paenibacillus campi]|nr:hypothetical protein [Paenibacillus sp. SGZ-1014]